MTHKEYTKLLNILFKAHGHHNLTETEYINILMAIKHLNPKVPEILK